MVFVVLNSICACCVSCWVDAWVCVLERVCLCLLFLISGGCCFVCVVVLLLRFRFWLICAFFRFLGLRCCGACC